MIAREWIGGLPQRMAKLPVDRRGFPVPRFVQWHDADMKPTAPGVGEPEFRVSSPEHLIACIQRKVCWICGETLGARVVFVSGPMSCIGGRTSEPPCHLACAVFAALNCPFMARPMATRRERGMPVSHTVGDYIDQNPGIAVLWVTRGYEVVRVPHGVLFAMGAPETITFYAHGRLATRAEIAAAIDKGFPKLLEIAQRQAGAEGIEHAHAQRQRFEKLYDRMAVY